jgi:hypothetical protein
MKIIQNFILHNNFANRNMKKIFPALLLVAVGVGAPRAAFADRTLEIQQAHVAQIRIQNTYPPTLDHNGFAYAVFFEHQYTRSK